MRRQFNNNFLSYLIAKKKKKKRKNSWNEQQSFSFVTIQLSSCLARKKKKKVVRNISTWRQKIGVAARVAAIDDLDSGRESLPMTHAR